MNNQALVRRFFAVVVAAVLAVAFAVVGTAPASAAVKGYLKIESVTDKNDPGLGLLVKDRPFNVVVTVLDTAKQPTTVSRATTVTLEEVPDTGALDGVTTATIPRNGSGVTISGAIYSAFGNGIDLRVRVLSGVDLEAATTEVDFAYSAVTRNASPHNSLSLTDSNCAAPTAQIPTCGQFILPEGANGRVTMSVGSCDGLGPCRVVGSTKALVVTAIADLKDSQDNPLYNKTSPATVVVACDKDLCRELANGVPKIPVIYTLENTGSLTKTAPPCPAKGVVGENQEACVDYVQSSRNQGDLYLVVLFVHDARYSI